MKNPTADLEKYRKFLTSIPLDKYREELKDIKFVEQDLVKPLYPLVSIFEHYWQKREFLEFDKWFNNFWAELNKNHGHKLTDLKELVRAHRKFYDDKVNDDLDNKVYLGFKARMYRTWVSVLTQLDFCYVFESICHKGNIPLILECNAELDSTGVDARVNNIGFQIAKISQRTEALKVVRKTRLIVIPYAVFDLEEFDRKSQSSRVKDKDAYRKAVEAFHKYLIRLPNGFIVFREDYLKPIIGNINNIERVKTIVGRIASELSGES